MSNVGVSPRHKPRIPSVLPTRITPSHRPVKRWPPLFGCMRRDSAFPLALEEDFIRSQKLEAGADAPPDKNAASPPVPPASSTRCAIARPGKAHVEASFICLLACAAAVAEVEDADVVCRFPKDEALDAVHERAEEEAEEEA